MRILLICCLVVPGLSWLARGQARVEVTRSAGSVTVREELPPKVALDPSGRVYHVEGCPSITPEMRLLSPGAAVLSGYRKASDCARRKPPKTYRTTTEPIKPRDGRALHVLFIGNSYTYYNELPWLLERISAGEAKPTRTHAVTMSGATLRQHWESGAALKAMNVDSYDYVVLQEQSLTPVSAFERMREYAASLDEEIRRTGAKTVLFQTWAPRSSPELQDPISTAYFRIGRELNARVARVGDAWRSAMLRRPDLQLSNDSSHPTLAGSYLAACVFYSLFYGKSPEGLPHEFPNVWTIPEASRAALVSEHLSAEEALFLQRTAWETVRRD